MAIMSHLKILLVLLVSLVEDAVLVTNVPVKLGNDTTEVLWNSSYHHSIHNRQNGKYLYDSAPKWNSGTPNATYALPYPYEPISDKYFPSTPDFPPTPVESSSDLKESLMDALHSVARNDDLQCVPKIVCEVTSGAMSGRQIPDNLPLNIDIKSLLGLISTFNGLQSSPVLHFAKAALLGYSAKGDINACNQSYPSCPSDPDKLVQYLNNHKGGFFKFFSEPTDGQNYAPSFQNQPYFQDYITKYFANPEVVAEERIQNNPESQLPPNVAYSQTLTFSHEGELHFHSQREPIDHNIPHSDFPLPETEDKLKFPDDQSSGQTGESNRQPKVLSEVIDFPHDQQNYLDLQKPLPNHKATPFIFPVRTGTGELLLDTQELNDLQNPTREDEVVKATLSGLNDEISGRYEEYPTNERRDTRSSRVKRI